MKRELQIIHDAHSSKQVSGTQSYNMIVMELPTGSDKQNITYNLGLNYPGDNFVLSTSGSDCQYVSYFKTATGEPVILDSINELIYYYKVNDDESLLIQGNGDKG